MRERIMQLPAVVRQIGRITGDNRVYIEDYAYSYLKKLKSKKENLPVRAALYGLTFCKENIRFYFVYGVSCVIEELENGMTQEQIARTYFADYQLIGYANLYHKEELPEEKEGCYVFYETNEAMQNYLIYCNGRQEKASQDEVQVQKQSAQMQGTRHGQDYFLFLKELLWKFLLGIMVLVAAVAVSGVNHYDGICEFAIMAAKAVQEIR